AAQHQQLPALIGLTIHRQTLYADIALEAEGRFTVAADQEERAVYVLSGRLAVDGETYEGGQLLVLRRGQPVDLMAEQAARFMLFGGEPMEGPRYIWWNFVSSRLERIEQAQAEWSAGRFDTVPGDEAEFIPLPDTGTKPRIALGGRDFV
ncbi:MAG: pirin-like C-terminal cupin domain-containing protein, partial [Pseudomonadota bacterium]